jgi:hypothetical protein
MYQININRREYMTPVDMDAVRAATAPWLTDEQTNNRGDEGEWVFVRFGTVAAAVAAINALGYTTDEDE